MRAVLSALFLLVSCSMLISEALMPPLHECPPNTRRVGTCYPPYYKCNLGDCIPIVPNGYGVCCKGRGFY